MRFFKSFPAFTFHRRSKSDSSIPKPTLARDYIPNRPLSLDAAQAALFAAAIPACPKTFLFPTPTDASNAIFELETANARLQNDVSAFAHGCAQLRSELEAARADIFTQLHLNSLLQRQVQADRSEMDALQVKLAQYERFLGLMISVGLHQRVLGDAHVAMRAGIDPDQALVSAIKQAAAVPGSAWSTILPSITGPRTPDEYRSSLHLTLKTRKELRDAKKIAKFWKRIGEEARPGLVTPSVSTISSIHEPLPAERQKAVEELMASRHTSEVAAITIPASASSLSASTSSASASTSPTLPDITPSNSSSSDSPCLSPLASESFKTELASRSSTRLFKRGPAASVSKQTRPPLGQIDTNIARNAGQQSLKAAGKRKASSRDENTPPQVLFLLLNNSSQF
ncbi:hypothetical protein B0H14DRAFT_2766127 [Mycena olivaceomarginata]|nr:hypothetical protein B0H14DRAFT_2766127 [Mycena olivaceomarginata]